MKLWQKYQEFIKKKYNIEKPKVATWDGWEDWHDTVKAQKPFGYFCLETFPNFFIDSWNLVTNKISNTKSWIRYRTFDRYHIIDTGLNPGYHDFDERCLHGLFNMLVDHVEKDMAWHCAIFSEEDHDKYPWWSKGWFKFKTSRQPQLGIKHLIWESGLDNPTLAQHHRLDFQAERAREVLDLYHWWKYVRPLRKDPMDLSGWSDLCDDRRNRGISILSDKGRTSADRQRDREGSQLH